MPRTLRGIGWLLLFLVVQVSISVVSKIAAELFLSVKTVSTYRSRVLEKMGMKTNAALTYYAIKNKLIE